jgi:hypothetical protein
MRLCVSAIRPNFRVNAGDKEALTRADSKYIFLNNGLWLEFPC